MSDLAAMLRLKEAIASVSLSHDPNCDCRTCKATLGDEEALAEIYAEIHELDEK